MNHHQYGISSVGSQFFQEAADVTDGVQNMSAQDDICRIDDGILPLVLDHSYVRDSGFLGLLSQDLRHAFRGFHGHQTSAFQSDG